VNKTNNNHLYHDGFVQRQIVVEGNTVFIRHYGEGVNRSMDLERIPVNRSRILHGRRSSHIRLA
jgi:hypothetical protein